VLKKKSIIHGGTCNFRAGYACTGSAHLIGCHSR